LSVLFVKTLVPDRQEILGQTLAEVIFFAISYSQFFKMLLASIFNWRSKINLWLY